MHKNVARGTQLIEQEILMNGRDLPHESQTSHTSQPASYTLVQDAIQAYRLPPMIQPDESRSFEDQQLCMALEQLAIANRSVDQCRAEIERLLASAQAAVQSAITLLTRRQRDESGMPRVITTSIATAPAEMDDDAYVASGSSIFEIRCLGHFAVYYDGRQLALPHNRKAEAILKYLIMHNSSPVSRDVLMRLCWPEASPATALNDLNTTISILRTCLGKELVAGTGSPILYEMGHYCLNPEMRWRIDIVDFDARYERGLEYERRGSQAEAMAEFAEAASLYHGDLLAADLVDDRTMIERERLKSIFMTLLMKLGSYWLASGKLEDSISYAYQLLKHDPCREEAHRLLICCFSRLQQRTQALHQYELCRSLLHRGMGIEPAPETVVLWQRVKQGETV
jgi:DNA-binding SARP family transcriptional activator